MQRSLYYLYDMRCQLNILANSKDLMIKSIILNIYFNYKRANDLKYILFIPLTSL
ncbi:hypothetical protein RIR_e44720_A0A2N0NYI6_9GLOM [Rhizophagus irregularis DAOM 181602=DAOM 197198]|nr:hypothetical protein RIR_e44720_A0A2N0NYI6_9GLOM [Rhizophagus irregularis DAOM 181602=DAOM 197198]